MAHSTGCLAIIVVGCLFLAFLGEEVPLDLLYNLAIGWALYCYGVLPQSQPSGEIILTAVLCLVALVFGTHAFFRWFTTHLPATARAGTTAACRSGDRVPYALCHLWTGTEAGRERRLSHAAGLRGTGAGQLA